MITHARRHRCILVWKVLHSGGSQRSSHLLLQSDTEAAAAWQNTQFAWRTFCQLPKNGDIKPHSADTHFFKGAHCQHTRTHKHTQTHTLQLGRRAQIAGSSLHAAQSTAAGTNQHNPPADRYGSLTATQTQKLA